MKITVILPNKSLKEFLHMAPAHKTSFEHLCLKEETWWILLGFVVVFFVVVGFSLFLLAFCFVGFVFFHLKLVDLK